MKFKFYTRISIVFLLSLGSASTKLSAQVLHYFFNQTLNEIAGGPALTELTSCNAAPGSFVQETIVTSGGTCANGAAGNTFQFNAGGGLQFLNNTSFIGSSYTIHVFFKFSQALSGYGRIIDFSNSTQDAGIYLLNNCLNFYPSGNIGLTCPFVQDKYSLVSFSRDGQTNAITVYVDGVLFTTYNDLNHLYVSAAATPLKFFRDDNAVACEVKSGNIKYLSLSNTPSSTATIEGVWTNICSIALPVKRLSFSARVSGKDALLQWSTASEYNASHFEIERSNDGIHFSLGGKVAAKGLSSTITNYEFIDPAVAIGDNYYRLKEVDIDGRFDYSPVIKLSWNGEAKFLVFPTPAKTEVSISGLNPGSILQVYSATGGRLIQQVVNAQTTTLNISRLPAGTYFLRVWNGTDWLQQKIVKQ